ncbi:MAG: hypothetical protein JWM27_1558 [Gemmatimonadetes bacterium]|nr:hypothetical protein [Gemmatimonadota bacterium]
MDGCEPPEPRRSPAPTEVAKWTEGAGGDNRLFHDLARNPPPSESRSRVHPDAPLSSPELPRRSELDRATPLHRDEMPLRTFEPGTVLRSSVGASFRFPRTVALDSGPETCTADSK